MGKRMTAIGLSAAFVFTILVAVPGTASAGTRETARPATSTTVNVQRVGAAASHAVTPAVAPTPPFTQCPAIGFDASCGILIVITDSGATVYTDPTQGPYDGVEDTLIGVSNESSGTVASISLSSTTDLFGFDGDGICTFLFAGDSGCPYGTTGYEGPNTTFSNIAANFTSGVVDFTGGLAAGNSLYFSLEEDLQSVPIIPPTILTTSLSGGGQSGPSITVPPNVEVTDQASLSGTNAATATGTVTYQVYIDSGCTLPQLSDSPQPITTPGTLPASTPVSASFPGTYYWRAFYSGDVNNGPSSSPCGSEVWTVTSISCDTIYGVTDGDTNSHFFSVDGQAPNTLTPLGGVHAGTNFEGIEINPRDGSIYATTATSNKHGEKGFLYQVDDVTGALTPMFSTGFNDVEDLAYRPGRATLWSWVDGKGLITIDVSSQSASLVTHSARHFEALAWNNAGDLLYLAKVNKLWTWNPSTGAFKLVASNLPGPVLGLDVRPDGNLLLGVAKQAKILIWDPVTKTTVGNIPTPGFKPIMDLVESESCAQPGNA